MDIPKIPKKHLARDYFGACKKERKKLKYIATGILGVFIIYSLIIYITFH